MRLGTCCALFILGLALVSAVPAPKIIEKKSLVEDAKIEKVSDLKLEDAGSEKERTKKSPATFCVEIRPGSSEPTQTSCGSQASQSGATSGQLNVQPATQASVQPVQTLNLIDTAPQPAQQAQTFNIVQPAPQATAQQVETFNIVQPAQQSVAQPVQSYNFVQPAAQQMYNLVQPAQQAAASASSIVLPAPQPIPQSTYSLQIMQPAQQPCAQQAQTLSFVQPMPQQTAPHQTVNILQPAPQPAPAPEVAPAPAPAPVPVPRPTASVEIVRPAPEESKPSQVVNIIQPTHPIHEHTEALNVVPVEPECDEQMVFYQSSPMVLLPQQETAQLATVVQIPNVAQHCDHHHALYTECNCQPKNIVFQAANAGVQHVPVRERAMGAMFRSHHKGHQASTMPVMMYSTGSAANSPVVVQCDPRLLSAGRSPVVMRESGHSGLGLTNSDTMRMQSPLSQGRTSTLITLNGTPQQPSIYQKYDSPFSGMGQAYNPYAIRGYGPGAPIVPGVTINTFPQMSGSPVGPFYRQNQPTFTMQQPGFRSSDDASSIDAGSLASEANDLLQPAVGRKIPREVDASQLASEVPEENVTRKEDDNTSVAS